MSRGIVSFVPRERGIMALVMAQRYFREQSVDEFHLEVTFEKVPFRSSPCFLAEWRVTGLSSGEAKFIGIQEIGEIRYEPGPSAPYVLSPTVEGHRHEERDIDARIAAHMLGITENIIEKAPTVAKMTYRAMGREFSLQELEELARDIARTAIFLPAPTSLD